jgi:hypothetical protein
VTCWSQDKVLIAARATTYPRSSREAPPLTAEVDGSACSASAPHRLLNAKILGGQLVGIRIEPATWIEGIRYLLADYQFGDGRPCPHYRGEDQIWA